MSAWSPRLFNHSLHVKLPSAHILSMAGDSEKLHNAGLFARTGIASSSA